MQYAWNDKIRISALYSLPETEIDNWFPLNRVLPECGFEFSYEQQELIRAEKRLVVKTLGHVPAGDGEDDCEIQTAWFDGKPFAVLRRNGRSGRDRWVTHPGVLCEAVSYLVRLAAEMFEPDEFDDYQSADTELPVDGVFVGLLEARFVIPETLPPVDKRFMIGHAYHELDRGQEVIMSKTDWPPSLLRRGKSFCRYERPLTEQEIALNAKLLQADSPYVQQGFTNIFLYRNIARPDDYMDAVCF